jgi:hypothetical protein
MKKIIPLIFSVFSAIGLMAQAVGGWGSCEFATVAAMNAFDPSGSNMSCKKAFVVATNNHYQWNGTIWVQLSDDQAISLSTNTLTLEDGGSVDLSVFRENLYNTNGTLTGNRTATLSNFNLQWNLNGTGDFDILDNGTQAFSVRDNGRVAIGNIAPMGPLHIYETTGTAATSTAGSIILEHGNSGGTSSIQFKSTVNSGSDYAYIQYSEDGSGNGSTSENGLLTIGIQNDIPNSINQDDIAILPSGNLGVGTTSPDARLDVEGGAVRFSDYGTGTYLDIALPATPAAATYALAVDADGDIVETNTAKSSKIFYPPALMIDVSTTGNGRTLDLHQQYVNLYGTPAVVSSGAPPAIPTYAQNELYYYVTDYDNTIFSDLSISADGILTYDVDSVPVGNCAVFNVVFVVK